VKRVGGKAPANSILPGSKSREEGKGRKKGKSSLSFSSGKKKRALQLGEKKKCICSLSKGKKKERKKVIPNKLEEKRPPRPPNGYLLGRGEKKGRKSGADRGRGKNRSSTRGKSSPTQNLEGNTPGEKKKKNSLSVKQQLGGGRKKRLVPLTVGGGVRRQEKRRKNAPLTKKGRGRPHSFGREKKESQRRGKEDLLSLRRGKEKNALTIKKKKERGFSYFPPGGEGEKGKGGVRESGGKKNPSLSPSIERGREKSETISGGERNKGRGKRAVEAALLKERGKKNQT